MPGMQSAGMAVILSTWGPAAYSIQYPDTVQSMTSFVVSQLVYDNPHLGMEIFNKYKSEMWWNKKWNVMSYQSNISHKF